WQRGGVRAGRVGAPAGARARAGRGARAGRAGEGIRAPAETEEPLVAPPAPEIDVGRDAVRVKSAGAAVPPLSFTTCLTSVSDGALSLFVMVQVTSSPIASVILSGLEKLPPPVHCQLLAS